MVDPTGLCDVVAGGWTDGPANSPGIKDFSNSIGSNLAFPYSGLGISGSMQQFGRSTSNTVLRNAIIDAANQTPEGQKVNLFLYSGSAEDLFNIWESLGPWQGQIGNIAYLSPGLADNSSNLIQATGETTVWVGKGFEEDQITSLAVAKANDQGIAVLSYNCKHKSDCAFKAPALKNSAGKPCPDKKAFTRKDPNGSKDAGGGGQSFGGPNSIPCRSFTWDNIIVGLRCSDGSSCADYSLLGGIDYCFGFGGGSGGRAGGVPGESGCNWLDAANSCSHTENITPKELEKMKRVAQVGSQRIVLRNGRGEQNLATHIKSARLTHFKPSILSISAQKFKGADTAAGGDFGGTSDKANGDVPRHGFY
jgi:hypothetical protein